MAALATKIDGVLQPQSGGEHSCSRLRPITVQELQIPDATSRCAVPAVPCLAIAGWNGMWRGRVLKVDPDEDGFHDRPIHLRLRGDLNRDSATFDDTAKHCEQSGPVDPQPGGCFGVAAADIGIHHEAAAETLRHENRLFACAVAEQLTLIELEHEHISCRDRFAQYALDLDVLKAGPLQAVERNPAGGAALSSNPQVAPFADLGIAAGVGRPDYCLRAGGRSGNRAAPY